MRGGTSIHATEHHSTEDEKWQVWIRRCCCLFVTVYNITQPLFQHKHLATLECSLHSMVNTWATNKHTHPGLPDLPSHQQWQDQPLDKITAKKQELTIMKLATIEDQLLMKQENARANAHQPPSPGMTKKPRVQATSSSNPSVTSTNDGQCMY